MAFVATIKNSMILLATLSPLLLGFFLVMGSVFNNNIRGLVYLGGVLILSVINFFISQLFQGSAPVPPPNCNLIQFSLFNTQKNIPAFNSMFLAFTMAYLFLPMGLTNQVNPGVITALSLLFVIEAGTAIFRRCVTWLSVVLGFLFGGLLGAAYCCAFFYTGNGNLLYFNEILSNNVVCKRPQKQKFKCAIYKNGELVKNL